MESKIKNLDNYKKIIKEYVISKKIEKKEDLVILIESIKQFYNKEIIVNYDLLIKDEITNKLEKILKIKFEINNDNTKSIKI